MKLSELSIQPIIREFMVDAKKVLKNTKTEDIIDITLDVVSGKPRITIRTKRTGIIKPKLVLRYIVTALDLYIFQDVYSLIEALHFVLCIQVDIMTREPDDYYTNYDKYTFIRNLINRKEYV